MTVDIYSNWPIISQSTGGAASLINHLRRAFVTYGTPEELASDGGPEFTSTETRAFLHRWGVHQRLSSVAFPHSNCREDIGVKTMKRIITDNTGPKGELDTDALQIAILQYRNTPDPDTPAMCGFGRPTRDFISIIRGKHRPHETWRETLKAREEALRKRHVRTAETWAEHTKRLPPLAVGDLVREQNQTGHHPNKWDKTGSVVEVRQHDQYAIKIDESGRITLRNRKLLRKFSLVHYDRPIRSIHDDLATRVTGLTPVVTPQLPDENDPDSDLSEKTTAQDKTSHANNPRTRHTEAPDPSDATTSPGHYESSTAIGARRGTTSTSDCSTTIHQSDQRAYLAQGLLHGIVN